MYWDFLRLSYIQNYKMKIVANSKELNVEEQTTISELISSLGKNPMRCVVELNGEAMPYSKFANINLKEGDILVIMQIVAGG